MPTYQEDYDAINAAKDKLSGLTKQAGEQEAASATFRDDVMARVRQARADRGMTVLQNDLGQATTRLASGRAQVRERMGDVVNPLAVDSAVAAERGQALGTLATISNIMSEREGTIEDVIGAGKNKLIAAATATKSQADAAMSELQTLLQLVQTKQQEAQRQIENEFTQRKLDEDTRQFDETLAFNRFKEGGSGEGSSTTPPASSQKPSSKPTKTGIQASLSPPPMSSRPGTQIEYPKGSGIYWISTGDGWE